MAGLKTFLWALIIGTTLGAWGDMPHDWAKSPRVYHAKGGEEDRLMELIGCVLDEPIVGGKSFQCGERFVWIGPAGSTRLALGSISNVQVEGYAQEARAFTGTVGTRVTGRIERGVLFEGSCYGNVGNCVLFRGQGWEFRAVDGRLELVGPDGQLRDVWR